MAGMIDFNSPEIIESLEWSPDFDIGIEHLDNAHKKLFGVIRRVLLVLGEEDYARNRNVCREAVKFLETYTLQHFAEEEAYQKRIQYRGFQTHKSLHDNLRTRALPFLKKQLEENEYAHDSIEDFVSILVGWLTGHVLVEDQAFTGKAASLWSYETNEDIIANLDKEMHELMENVFRTELSMVDNHYSGEKLKDGIFYRMNFGGDNDFQCSVTVFAEMPVIYLMSGGMLGRKVFQIERTALLSYLQLIQGMSINIVHLIYPDANASISKTEKETAEGMRTRFTTGYPDVSLLWRTPEGRIGMCIEKRGCEKHPK